MKGLAKCSLCKTPIFKESNHGDGICIPWTFGESKRDLAALIQLMTDHPSARCDAILAEWRRRKDGTN